MLDASRRIAGEASYDPFGRPNRVALHAGTPHPYVDGQDVQLAAWTQVPGPGMVTRHRARFHRLETDAAGGDAVYFTDGVGGATLGSPKADEASGLWSGWLSPAGGQVVTRFRANAAGRGGANAAFGADLEGYEFQRYQLGAQPFWTPLRFPGQYADAETDLFENWNRYYDASTGRYLQPEPMLARPEYVRAMTERGLSVPAYAYALNNPFHWTDRNGLEVQNNSPNAVFIKGEHDETYCLAPGDTFPGKQDGVYGPDGTIYKTTDGVDAIVNPDGSIDTFGGSAIGQALHPYTGGMWEGWPRQRFFTWRHPDWPAPNASGPSACQQKRVSQCRP
ncbi:RHS repeat-associated core domain-containing protein [Aggregicoccus sp. 17bor-14]|nr:RHS repeat-associated core domain-containing protein [Simulacricoccus sp. 17bor-14]MRI92365.1 RHS repeat-associated core domain-containing protein [Aggregicoccus sp. 17bor-14]